MLKAEIRASLTMTKLAIQYFGQYSEGTPVLDQARKTFPSYNFKFLKRAQQLIRKWQSFNNKREITAAIVQADCFIEEFGQFIYKKAERPHRR
jgi:hypothetical protein